MFPVSAPGKAICGGGGMASFAVDAKQRVALNPKIPQCFPERLKLAIPPPRERGSPEVPPNPKIPQCFLSVPGK